MKWNKHIVAPQQDVSHIHFGLETAASNGGVVIGILCNHSSPQCLVLALNGSRIIPVTAIPYNPLFYSIDRETASLPGVKSLFLLSLKGCSTEQPMASSDVSQFAGNS